MYLDTAATTKPEKEIVDTMLPYFTENWHNPSSLYSQGVIVKTAVEESRKVIADYIGAKSNEICFTSSGSEANCWAIQGFIKHCKKMNIRPVIVTTTIEHKSILECVNDSCSVFGEVIYCAVGVDKDGVVLANELDWTLRKSCELNNRNCKILVSIQFANNELGVIQNIKELSDISHKYGAIFHTDAVQVFGKKFVDSTNSTRIDVNFYGIDLMSVSGHKIGCPKGIGFLYVREGIKINPIIYGSQMDGMRGGTENVPYIVSMAKAVDIIKRKEANVARNRFNHAEYILWCTLRNKFGCKINGAGSKYRLSNILSVTLPEGIGGEELLYLFDTEGICISTGSACNSYSKEPSHVLKAIGLTDEECARTIRLSLSNDFDVGQAEELLTSLKKSIQLLRLP